MANVRFWTVLAVSWFFTLILFPLFPALSILDPLFLLLVFLGFHLSSGRFLWAYGIFFGFLKDLSGGGLFGAWSCTFGFVGWILFLSRHLVEREDPLLQGIWAGLLTGASGLVYALVCAFSDPAARWGGAGWLTLPVTMAAGGTTAAWAFPRLGRWCRMSL